MKTERYSNDLENWRVKRGVSERSVVNLREHGNSPKFCDANSSKQKSVVILGCGFSGMLTALAFAKVKINTTIIEYQEVNNHRFCDDVRTTALTPDSVEFLDSINVWSEIKDYTSKMLEVYVVDNKAPEMLCLSNIQENTALGYIVQNHQFKQSLLQAVQNNPYIQVLDRCSYHKVDSHKDYSILHLDNDKTIKCGLLVVCDGYDSKARHNFFSDRVVKTYKQAALTFNIIHEKKHENCAVEHFMPSGPFAILPLKDQHCSSIIWTSNPEQAALLKTLPKEEFEYLVGRNCGNSYGSIILDSDIKVYPLKARITNRYFYNTIVLVADSAHIIHPLAGQGLNQGIKDIATITELVADSGINQEILQKYEEVRADDNYAMYTVTDSLDSIFSNHYKSLWYLRRVGLKTIDHFSAIKNLLLNYAMGQRENLF